MSNDLLQKRWLLSAADTPNIDSAGAVSEFVWPAPIIVTKVGFISTTAVNPDNSVALTATLSRRPTLGSSTNAVTLGVFSFMAANATNTVAGDVKWKELHVDSLSTTQVTAEDGTTRNAAPATVFDTTASILASKQLNIIKPGQSFAITLDTNAEADSGAVVSFIEFLELPFDLFNLGTNVTRDTSQDLSTTSA